MVWSLAVTFLAILCLPSLSIAETAVYDATWLVPRCTSGVSPCTAPSSLLNGRDTMSGGAEPHQPNTLSTSPCADGSSGTYHARESLDAVAIYDWNGSQFFTGDTVEVDATVWCYTTGTDDSLYVYQTDNPSLPTWNYKGSAACTATGSEVLSVSFNLGTLTS